MNSIVFYTLYYGVETKEELKCVKELGCDYIQGFLISKPDFEIKDISEDMKKIIQEIMIYNFYL